MRRFVHGIAGTLLALTACTKGTADPPRPLPTETVDGEQVFAIASGLSKPTLRLADAAWSADGRFLATIDSSDSPHGFLILCDLVRKSYVVADTWGDALDDWDRYQSRLIAPGFLFTRDGPLLVLPRYVGEEGDFHQVVQVIDPESGEVLRSSEPFRGTVWRLRVSPDERHVAALIDVDAETRRIASWALGDFAAETSCSVSTDTEDFDYRRSGDEWITVTDSLVPVEGDPESSRHQIELRVLRIATGEHLDLVAPRRLLWRDQYFSRDPEGNLRLSGSTREEPLRLVGFDLESGEKLFDLEQPAEEKPYDQVSHALHPSAKIAALGYRSGRIRIVDTETGAVLLEVSEDASDVGGMRDVLSIAFDESGDRLLRVEWGDRAVRRDVSSLLPR